MFQGDFQGWYLLLVQYGTAVEYKTQVNKQKFSDVYADLANAQ
jgi:hypothetical protein